MRATYIADQYKIDWRAFIAAKGWDMDLMDISGEWKQCKDGFVTSVNSGELNVHVPNVL